MLSLGSLRHVGGDTNVESMKQISKETHSSSMISPQSRHEPRIQPWISWHELPCTGNTDA